MNNHLIPKNSRHSYIFAFDDKKVTFFRTDFCLYGKDLYGFIWKYFPRQICISGNRNDYR